MLYGIVLMVLALFTPLLRAWVGRRIAASTLRLRVRPDDDASSASDKVRPVTIEASWWLPNRLSRLPWSRGEIPLALPGERLSTLQALKRLIGGTILHRRQEPARSASEIASGVAYRVLAEGLRPEIGQLLDALRSRLGSRSMQITLDLGSDLHNTAWEAAFDGAGDVAGPPEKQTSFRYRREAEGRAPRRPSRTGEAYVATGPLDQSLSYEVVREGWAPLEGVRGWLFDWSEREALATKGFTGQAREAARVLHLVGESEQRLDGVSFGLASEAAESYIQQNTYAPQEQEIHWMRTEEIGEYPYLALCIVQGEPRAQTPGGRTSLGRRNAALMREYAAQVYAQGVPAVLVLPPLPPDVATTAIQRVARALRRRRRRGAHELLQAVAEIQAAILAQEGLDPEVAWEQAYDVCLYCAHDWDGRLT
jgi:hypothetical protein